jgi:alpha-glucosidase (family GH31 glycosyl hydrolase)
MLTGPGVAGARSASPAAEIHRDSGRIEIKRLGSGRLVESAAAQGPGGRIGFRSGDTWFHAAEVVKRSRHSTRRKVVLATDHPAGAEIVLRVQALPKEGAVTLRARVRGGAAVDSVGIGFETKGAERYLGFGERSNAVDQRGNEVENYVGEGPYAPLDYPIMKTQVPSWGIRERRDATYFPMPWLLSTRGFGALIENHETSRFRLESERAGEWSAEVDAPRMRMRVFAGPRPVDVVRRMTAEVGRQPKPFAPWQFGPWVQTGHQNTEPDELSHLEALRAADAPLSAVETHMRYMPCGSDYGEEAEEAARTQAFHGLGLAALTYTREAICETYTGPWQEAIATNAFLRRADGSPYTFPAFVGSGQTEVGMLDFTNPAARDLYGSILDRPYENGYDGWMEDYGEYAPPDSAAANGMTGAEMHNFYPVAYHRAGFRYVKSKSRPVIRFVRSGWTGVHPYAQIVWGGDPSTDWGFDGLASSVTQALTMGLSGISSWGSDIGGFFTLTSPPLTEELLIRWIQFGAVSGVMRTKGEGIGLAQDQRPQVWEQPVLDVWRLYAKLRTQLYPYLMNADRTYRRTGMPIMRHLALAHPGDPQAVARDDEFLFGPDLLAAPVVEQGATRRELYLPRGAWIDFWEALRFDPENGRFSIDGAKVMKGRSTTTVEAPLEELPLHIRAGAVLPLLPPGIDTLSRYGRDSEGTTRLADERGRLQLLAFPRGRSRSRFLTDGRVKSIESRRGGRWTLEIDGERSRRYVIQASLTSLRDPFEPDRVLIDGRRARGWQFDPESGRLWLAVTAKEARVVVAAR